MAPASLRGGLTRKIPERVGLGNAAPDLPPLLRHLAPFGFPSALELVERGSLASLIRASRMPRKPGTKATSDS